MKFINVKQIPVTMLTSLAVFLFVGCQAETTPTYQPDSRFIPEPTPQGSWAGLTYNEEGWQLRVVKNDEIRENPNSYAYFKGQEILTNNNYEGCEISYWFGGGGVDEFGEYPDLFSYISYEQTLNDNNFGITLHLISGKLDYIGYAFISSIRNAPNVFENGYLGTLRLRLVDTEIDPCIRETEWLLSEINTSGMYTMKETFYEWDNERRFGVP